MQLLFSVVVVVVLLFFLLRSTVNNLLMFELSRSFSQQAVEIYVSRVDCIKIQIHVYQVFHFIFFLTKLGVTLRSLWCKRPFNKSNHIQQVTGLKIILLSPEISMFSTEKIK